ncbi:MAG TPA: D-2-hydroxyacid dehydrogenase, partial [Burkholderiaceae bacterium]|nr:D-2-hydroxyacid dehydrogenase [Burkholderiaceae bacterium]
MLPARDRLTICFAHGAYRMAERFALRKTGIAHLEVRSADQLAARLPEADVLVVSMLWTNELAGIAGRLKFIQSISAGTDQYDKALLRERGIRLASAAGVNAQAVAEHAMALMLALARRLPEARDNQNARRWRGMISEIAAREDQLTGKTLLVVGMGRIGSRLARLAKAFEMRVVATKRDPSTGTAGMDAVYTNDRLHELLRQADIVALTCPLTPDTENLIDAAALAAMKPTAHLVNVARGRVVDEPALVEALQQRRIAAAGLDVTREEPLPESSPLWTMPNVLITPHTAGETQRYEDAVIDILLDNL